MKKIYRIAIIVAVIVIIVLIGGYYRFSYVSSSSPSNISGQVSSLASSSQVSSNVTVDACSYLTPANVSSALNVTAVENQTISPAVCQYQVSTANTSSVVAMVTALNYNSPSVTREIYDQAIKSGAFAVQGLGDMALEQTLPYGSALDVIKNGNFVQIEVDKSISNSMLKAKSLALIIAGNMK